MAESFGVAGWAYRVPSNPISYGSKLAGAHYAAHCLALCLLDKATASAWLRTGTPCLRSCRGCVPSAVLR